MDTSDFSEPMRFHKLRISILVIPFMLLELGSSIWLAIAEGTFSTIHQTGLAIVIVIWLITFFVQVPLHDKLSEKYNKELVNRLVRSNMYRSVLWTIKALLACYIIMEGIRALIIG
jgi:hypothetical protein